MTKIFYKTCKTCSLEKPIEDFYKESHNLTDGHRGSCKKCTNIQKHLYNKATKDERNKKARDKYKQMSELELREHIKKKSNQNKIRKNKPEVLEKIRAWKKTDRARFCSYRNDAIRRNRDHAFELTFDEFSEILHGNCAYCGKENANGIDRVINSVGYQLKNCVPCCHRCNEIKMKFSVASTFDHIEKMIKNKEKCYEEITSRLGFSWIFEDQKGLVP